MSTYVISDIHGRYDLWCEMKSKIGLTDCDDKLIVIGDAIDRGPDGIKILKDIMDSNNIKMLLGNHELMMFEADIRDCGYLTNTPEHLENIRNNWLYNNGGYVTMKAFFDLPTSEQGAIMDFIQKLVTKGPIKRTKVEDMEYILCHGWPVNPDDVDTSQEALYQYVFDAVWGRPSGRTDKPIDIQRLEGSNKRLIIGHTPTLNLCTYREIKELREANARCSIMHAPWFINIDCGCGHNDPRCRLGCMCLDTGEEFYVG